MRLVDIEDTSLLKTIADGRLSAKAVWRLIKAQPIVDAVPVIRCKDCIYYRWKINMCDEPYSTAHNVVHEDDYCSRAERKEE